MAINAGRGVVIAILDCFRMEAAIVRGLFVGMASGTNDLGRSCLMRRRLNVSVAVDAGKHPAMNRHLEFLLIDVEADRFPVNPVT